MKNYLIKNAIIIDPKSKYHNQKMCVKIQDGIIVEIAEDIKCDFQVIENENQLYISNGWIDSSVSLGEPGFEDRETIANGLSVAEKSGFTHLMVNPNTNPVVDNQSVVSFIKEKAAGSKVTLCPIGALTKNQEGKDLAEMYDMQKAGAVAFGDYKKSIDNANLLKIGLQYVQDFDGTIIAFCNDNSIKGKGVVHEGYTSTRLGLKGIPPLAEEIIVARNLFLLEYTGGKMHIPTISTKKSVELIREAKAKGLKVTCSVAVHNLIFNDEVLTNFDTRYKVNPPLRDEETRKILVEAVKDNTIDIITSDHQPWDIEHKKLEFDLAKDGTIGLETAFGSLLCILPLEIIVDKLTKAHEIFLKETPKIDISHKACITIFSTDNEKIFTKQDILSKSKNSAFLNQTIKGKIIGIIN